MIAVTPGIVPAIAAETLDTERDSSASALMDDTAPVKFAFSVRRNLLQLPRQGSLYLLSW